MFEYLKGTVASATPHKLVIDVSGLGYILFISIRTFEKLPKIGADIQIFISTVYREDSQKMYGFLTLEERDLFETLNEISGIGPRLSVALLGHLAPNDLYLAVDQANMKAISQVPGIGKKMAERLVIELRDKFHKIDKQKMSPSSSQAQGVVADAINALINLGYNPLDAQKAVKKALPSEGKEPPLPQLISLALKTKV